MLCGFEISNGHIKVYLLDYVGWKKESQCPLKTLIKKSFFAFGVRKFYIKIRLIHKQSHKSY